MSGGIAEIINPETGKITYKAKTDATFLYLESFDGIVKFNKKGAKATIIGSVIDLQDCEIIQKSSPKYKPALFECFKAERLFLQSKRQSIDAELLQLEKKISELNHSL